MPSGIQQPRTEGLAVRFNYRVCPCIEKGIGSRRQAHANRCVCSVCAGLLLSVLLPWPSCRSEWKIRLSFLLLLK